MMSNLGEIFTATLAILWAPFGTLFSLKADLNVFNICGAIAVASIFYLFSPSVRGKTKSYGEFLFPKSVYLHPSAILDYKYYFCFILLRTLYMGALIIGVAASTALIETVLTAMFGAGGIVNAPVWLAMLLATIVEVMCFELGYWFGHRILHEVPALWEFHKVHHSAAVLTPTTGGRVHPVDDVVMGNCNAVMTGFGLGAMSWLFGEAAHPYTIMGVNAWFVIYVATFFHMRHTQIWIAFTGPFGHVMQSPAHHQIHHSDAPVHAGTNLGYGMVFWDWVFGTLHVPTKQDQETIVFGMGPEGAEYRDLYDGFILPFVKAARLALPRKPDPHSIPAE